MLSCVSDCVSDAGLQEVEDDRPRGGYACGWGIEVSRKELRTGAILD